MRIIDIREVSVPLSRYADGRISPAELTTSLVAVTVDCGGSGYPVHGFGMGSFGRFAQGGLIRERFAPRLLDAPTDALLSDSGSLDPERAWATMMQGEKPGGHGERCVAVGALDIALWDAAAKISNLPLHAFLRQRTGSTVPHRSAVRVYYGGGYPYPKDDLCRLDREMRAARQLGFTHAKLKVGKGSLQEDLRRLEVASTALGGPERVAVDGMHSYGGVVALAAAKSFDAARPWWIEDMADPHDFATQAALAKACRAPQAAGEALFSLAESKLLDAYGGLRHAHDILLFDPIQCYGLTGYLGIVRYLVAQGWPLRAFWPHGGHLFSMHVAAGLGLGGSEVNAFAFAPIGGLHDGAVIADDGVAYLPQLPGVGVESKDALHRAFRETLNL